MKTAALVEIHNTLLEHLARGDEDGAEKILRERFLELPEQMQGQILGSLYIESAKQQIERAERATEIRKELVAAITILEMVKKELAKDAA